jgi:hypothetical protein
MNGQFIGHFFRRILTVFPNFPDSQLDCPKRSQAVQGGPEKEHAGKSVI